MADASSPHAPATASGLKAASASRTSSRPATWSCQVAEVGQVLVEQGVGQPGQQQRIGARTDREVLVGARRGPGPARVDDHQPAAPRPQVLEALRHVRHGPQSSRWTSAGCRRRPPAGRSGRCRAPGSASGSPNSSAQRAVLGHLVDGAGGRERRRVRRACAEHAAVQLAGEGVDVGVAQVQRRRRSRPWSLVHRGQALVDEGEGLVPVDLAPVVALVGSRGRVSRSGSWSSSPSAAPFGQM